TRGPSPRRRRATTDPLAPVPLCSHRCGAGLARMPGRRDRLTHPNHAANSTENQRPVSSNAGFIETCQLPEIAQTVITHRYPIEDAPEAFRAAAARNAGAIKVVIEP